VQLARRLRRILIVALVAALLAELVLQLARPVVLDDVRQRTLPFAGADADYITLQSINFDPATHRPLLVDDPEVFWTPLPDQHGSYFLTEDVRTNELGLRGPPLAPRATASEVRLLFLGDSVTFGMRVAEDERYSDQLAARLRAEDPGLTVTVMNAGVIGYATSQVLTRLPAWMDAAQPDVVVWALGLNDSLLLPASDAQFRAERSSSWESVRRGMRESQFVCGLELGWAWLRRGVDERATGRRRALSSWLHYPRLPAGKEREPRTSEAEFFAALERVQGLCRERGAELVLITPFASAEVPSVRTPDPDYFERLRQLCAGVRDFGARRGVPVADTRSALESSGRPPQELLLDFCHPTPAGHAIVAAELLRALQAAGLPARWKERARGG
jgi:lysophospholipase L1-like esterase